VLEGLQGASLQRGAAFDRAAMDRMLSAVGNRVFLMNNVNDSAPTIFQTRFALSYLRGPLSREEISKLMADARRAVLRNDNSAAKPIASDSGAKVDTPTAAPTGGRPIVSAGIEERFIEPDYAVSSGSRALLVPALLGSATVHFVRATGNIDIWKDYWLLAPIDQSVPEHVWDQALRINPDDVQITKQPVDGFAFAELPAELLLAKNYKGWDKELSEFLFRHEKMNLYSCKAIKRNATPGLDEFSARLELGEFAREARDEAMDKVRAKYEERIGTFEIKVAAAQQRLDRSIEEAKAKRLDGLVNLGTSILGSLLGGRRRSMPSSAVRDLTGSGQSNDVSRAQETLENLVLQKNAMERECQHELDAIESQYSIENLRLEESEIPIRKSDTKIKLIALAWVPYSVDAQGKLRLLIKSPS
jgi:hypothetical protein